MKNDKLVFLFCKLSGIYQKSVPVSLHWTRCSSGPLSHRSGKNSVATGSVLNISPSVASVFRQQGYFSPTATEIISNINNFNWANVPKQEVWMLDWTELEPRLNWSHTWIRNADQWSLCRTWTKPAGILYNYLPLYVTNNHFLKTL